MARPGPDAGERHEASVSGGVAAAAVLAAQPVHAQVHGHGHHVTSPRGMNLLLTMRHCQHCSTSLQYATGPPEVEAAADVGLDRRQH